MFEQKGEEIMYRVGICDDGINMCALLEEMILKYAKSTNTLVETMVLPPSQPDFCLG